MERYMYIDVWEGGQLRDEIGLWALWGGNENRERLRVVDSKGVRNWFDFSFSHFSHVFNKFSLLRAECIPFFQVLYRMLEKHHSYITTGMSAMEMAALVEPQEPQLRMALARIYRDYMKIGYYSVRVFEMNYQFTLSRINQLAVVADRHIKEILIMC